MLVAMLASTDGAGGDRDLPGGADRDHPISAIARRSRRVRLAAGDINDGFNEVTNGMRVIQQFRQQARWRTDAQHAHYYLARVERCASTVFCCARC